MSHLSIGVILNNSCYRIKSIIGQGGFGITYLADEIGYYRSTGFGDKQYVQAVLPEVVVIKELFYADYCIRNEENNDVLITNSEKRTEFERLVENQLNEGKKLRMLNHPNIVRTRDIFKENNTAYMVMDYVDSLDLETIICEEGSVKTDVALKYITQILSALCHIHEQNQLHLDIKPSNILIRKNSDEAVLIDFGASQSYSSSGEIIGRTSQLISAITRCYAPNEQADIDNLKHFDATFDTYAVGATFYHILTGQRPPLSSLLSTGRQKLIPPSALVPALKNNDYIDAIIDKALEAMYHNRFKSAKEFLTELQKIETYSDFITRALDFLKKKDFIQAKLLINNEQKEYLPTGFIEKINKIIQNEEARTEKDKLYKEFLYRGTSKMNQRKYDEAIELFNEALIIYPGREDHELLEKIKYCQKNSEKDILRNEIKSGQVEFIGSPTEIVTISKIRDAQQNSDNGKKIEKTKIIDSSQKRKNVNHKLRKIKSRKLPKNQMFAGVSVFALTIILLIIWFFAKNSTGTKARDIHAALADTAAAGIDSVRNSVTKTPVLTNHKTHNESTINKRQAGISSTVPEKEKSVEPVTVTEKTESTITFGGKKYTGMVNRKGLPNGSGTLYFNEVEIVSENDTKQTKAEAGDYLKGRWNNGELEYGILFDQAGNKKGTIIIGRY